MENNPERTTSDRLSHWYSVTEREDDETQNDQDDSGETKTNRELIRKSLNLEPLQRRVCIAYANAPDTALDCAKKLRYQNACIKYTCHFKKTLLFISGFEVDTTEF